MERKLIDEINEKTPIVELVSEFVSLTKRGKNYMGLCPFHQEKTPSFSVSPEKNIAKCMSCGEGGSPINFYRKIKNITLNEAANELARRAGIIIENVQVKKDPYDVYYRLMKEAMQFYRFNLMQSEKGQEALKYLYNRQMSDTLLDHFNIGYAPPHGQTLYLVLKDKGFNVSDMILLGMVKQDDEGQYYDLFSDRIIFPITDPKGRVVGFSGRTMNPKETVKYINSPETVIFKKGQLLYHFYEAMSDIRKSKQVVLYEGFFDVISSYQAGVKQGVATMGTALTKDQAKLIRQATKSMIVAYDGDQAGMKASLHAIPILEAEKLSVEVLTIPDKMDPDEFIKAYGPEAYEALFGEYTKDIYQYRYDMFKSGKDLHNANDIQDFKKNVMQMIRYSDESIKKIYLNKLSTDLGVDTVELINTKKPKEIVYPISTKERDRLKSKYEKAERYLIQAMLKNRDRSVKILAQLTQHNYANHLTVDLRYKIESYYQEHLEMDLEELKDRLNDDQRNYLENEILTDFHWTAHIDATDQEVSDFIQLIKDADLIRRYDYLKMRIESDQDSMDRDLEEMNRILLHLKHKK